jgi:D-psicose/D-tagatose/L-ribulose 3-epimerase
MKIGMNLLLFTTQPDDSAFPIGEKLKGMGFDGLEWPVLGTEPPMAEKIRRFNEQQKLGCTAVFVFGPGHNPISGDESERNAALDRLKNRIDLCAIMGAELLCGPIVQPLGHFTGKGPTRDEWSRCVSFFKSAGDYAAKKNVTLVIEYLNRFEIYFVNTAADACRLCDEINHPNVTMMVDSFHANIEEKSMYNAVLAARPHLRHIHISENDRGVPGSGKIIHWDDFFRGIKDAGYDGWLTIESFGQALPDLAAAAKIWRKLFDSDDQVCREGLAFVRKMLAGRASA